MTAVETPFTRGTSSWLRRPFARAIVARRSPNPIDDNLKRYTLFIHASDVRGVLQQVNYIWKIIVKGCSLFSSQQLAVAVDIAMSIVSTDDFEMADPRDASMRFVLRR